MSNIRSTIRNRLWRAQQPPFRGRAAGAATSPLSDRPILVDVLHRRRPSIILVTDAGRGDAAFSLASHLKSRAIDAAVIAVDTWTGSWRDWVDDEAFRIRGTGGQADGFFADFNGAARDLDIDDFIIPLPLDAKNTIGVLRNHGVVPDIIYIDAAGETFSPKADVEIWWRLLMPGGLLIVDGWRGDDFSGTIDLTDDLYPGQTGSFFIHRTGDTYLVSKPRIEAMTEEFPRLLTRTAGLVQKWREDCRIRFTSEIETESTDAVEEIQRYILFNGPAWHPIRSRIQEQIARKFRIYNKNVTSADIFERDGAVRSEFIAAVRNSIPGFKGRYHRPVDNAAFDRFELLAPFENPYTGFALPGRLNRNMGTARSPAFVAYRGRDHDLFLTPLGYELFRDRDGVYWPLASTGAYSAEAMEQKTSDISNTVVIAQDTFEGTNFSHFLLDWVPRIGHLIESGLVDARDCVFVLGGVPSEFHVHVIRSLCDMYDLRDAQFFFPDQPIIWSLRGEVWFFSDVREAIMHPANMAHPKSMRIVRDVCARIKTVHDETRRIYISRGDTPLRRIGNKAELMTALHPLGFVEVQLGKLPFLEQVKVMREAEVIVAPHGMGLTHILFHQGSPLVVELHNPLIGTDTYAFPAHALGFRYHPVVGEPIPGDAHDFNIGIADVLEVLAREGVEARPVPALFSGEGLLVEFRRGVQATGAQEVVEWPEGVTEGTIYRHVRDDPAGRPDDNVAWIEVRNAIEGRRYVCSCDVWIPQETEARHFTLLCEEFMASHHVGVDMSKRGRWQRAEVEGIATGSVVNVVARFDAVADAVCYTSRWRIEAGREENPVRA